ncbi:hypothetical protein DSO57_1020890 [Entomophthora muscae]|uniref:Uncharacterized protein n=1 Tax=Entomophthora muscae TaxID=34485 RepID=A0ACC2RUK9_9FUNG|nr:hypothetical protein DSO57_1020890 [Entomophthora muscae]
MKSSLLIASLITNGQAHILMKNPPSDKYKGRNDIPESQKDYSLTTPMSPDRIGNICGSVEKIVSSGSYAAGSTVNVELEGSAVHDGGHCQFGFSYDRSTFAVTHKVFGNCVSGSKSYSVPIPSSAPSGPVTFFWSWFNRSGNREMYTNCGQITITGGTGSSIPGKALLVANIVSSDVKFPEGFADDFGKDLFEAQPNVSVQPSGSYNTGQNTQNPTQGSTEVKEQPNNQNNTSPSAQPNPQQPNPQNNQPQPNPPQPSPQNNQPQPNSQQPSPQNTQPQPNSQQANTQENPQNNYHQQNNFQSRYQQHYQSQYQRPPNMQYQPPSGAQGSPQLGGRPYYQRGYGRW